MEQSMVDYLKSPAVRKSASAMIGQAARSRTLDVVEKRFMTVENLTFDPAHAKDIVQGAAAMGHLRLLPEELRTPAILLSCSFRGGKATLKDNAFSQAAYLGTLDKIPQSAQFREDAKRLYPQIEASVYSANLGGAEKADATHWLKDIRPAPAPEPKGGGRRR
jgi:hypothetical protein